MASLKPQFDRDGFVLIRGVVTQYLPAMRWSVDNLGDTSKAVVWTGPWDGGGSDATLIAGHFNTDTESVWTPVVKDPWLSAIACDLLAVPAVSIVRATVVSKPPRTGQAFPLHQDAPFYREDERDQYLIMMLYLDDVTPDNGGIRFLQGSHTQGMLPHVKEDGALKRHLPRDRYRMADTVEPPGKAGDIVCFSVYTVHGSYPNRSDQVRRTARFGFMPA